ncbi:hypothetical protein LTR36_005771 [Oleoguttula mirabilis]|uniref:Amine oxidase domain-containing protein n=1 Tax=Oleoguttula mirabilis TaxID=1507867 RepID=A0AAV9JDZ4_9PEZI|nr:hypothetical protein LTR36_005771 [Oleoguttula mirabilis]
MASNNTASNSRHYDTIILGAGISGLACASRLWQHPRLRIKPNSVLVLEARDRIGGRIGSVQVDGSRLDTGANWIHGVGTAEAPNPLLKVLPHQRYRELAGTVVFRAPVKEGGLTGVDDDEWVQVDGSDASSPSAGGQSGSSESLVIPSAAAAPLQAVLWGLIGSLHEAAEEASPAEAQQTTMLQAIAKSEVFRDAFCELPAELHATLSGLPQFIENMEAAPLAAQSAEHELGRAGFGLLEFAIEDFDGDQVFLRDGYTAVVDEVATDLIKAGIVELGEEVRRISWDAGPIAITASSGVYTADRVVCTLPLGVLQHHAGVDTSGSHPAALFTPALPQKKAEAIASLGAGTLDKIFLVYSHAWWTEEPYLSIYKQGIVGRPDTTDNRDHHGKPPPYTSSDAPDAFLGFTDELPGIAIQADGTSEPGLRILSVINLHALTGFPVLSTFVSCSNATYIESLSNEQAGAIVHRSLTAWLGREPPKPDAVHVTRWAQDEYSRGSYSHMITGLSETRHREEFQTPVVSGKGGELRFAGEHTSRNHFATVHGALLSGWREADAIVATQERRD